MRLTDTVLILFFATVWLGAKSTRLGVGVLFDALVATAGIHSTDPTKAMAIAKMSLCGNEAATEVKTVELVRIKSFFQYSI
jgi:hypothetical protein